ncbi:MAG: DUF1844 domain-containing protein [Desulfobacterales bacterium]|nr:DUF1844 domain-containing protein [Desulfobacterales bacterium]
MSEKKDFIIKDTETVSDDEQKNTGNPEEKISAGSDSGETFPFPAINFATFIMSLNASALLHLGALADPETGEKSKNLPLAKQTIEIMNMLEEKTKGNLTDEEAQILKNMLYDLRIIYVKERK